MERFWHCFNCSTDFAAVRDLCPKCGADGKDPKAGGCIAPRTVIHLDPPHATLRNRGTGAHACDPTVQVGTQGMRASGEITAVNCPACLASKAGQELQGNLDVPHAYRVPATIAAVPTATIED